MKSFFNFQKEANDTLATFQATRLGLVPGKQIGKSSGAWYGRKSKEFIAKTVDGNLKFYNQNQQFGKKDPNQIRGNRYPNEVASDYKPNNPIKTEEQIFELRDKYISKKIYLEGDWVENLNTGMIGKIIRRGTNYLICVTEDGQMFKPWIYDVLEWTQVSGVFADQRLVGTDAHREYVMGLIGYRGIKNFINKYKVKKKK